MSLGLRPQVLKTYVTVSQGTLQFMAHHLLLCMAFSRYMQPLEHQAKHDIESILWVLSYAILRHLSESTDDTVPQLQESASLAYKACFSHVQITTLAARRTGCSGPFFFMTTFASIRQALSRPTVVLLENIEDMLTAAHRRIEPEELRHDAVLAALDDAIASLQTCP